MVRRPRATALVLLALALLAGLAVVSLRYGPVVLSDANAIRLERAKRRLIHASGTTLPGTPDLSRLSERLASHGVELGAPILIRIFKLEFELEVWMRRDGRFHHIATYPICRYSGGLGPKLAEGDRQSPEGFYTVDRTALNPHSRWHRSFNLGFPNLFDRTHGRTGSFLMVHGGCSSIGCYAMTDPVVDEIWTLVTAALKRGQNRFQVHVFPFRLTPAALEKRAAEPGHDFWTMLKPAYDLFETTLLPPRITVCRGAYRISSGRDGDTGAAPIDASCSDTARQRDAAGRR